MEVHIPRRLARNPQRADWRGPPYHGKSRYRQAPTDLVILDEFQRYKDLLQSDPRNFAVDLAKRLLNHTDPQDWTHYPNAASLRHPVSHVHDWR